MTALRRIDRTAGIVTSVDTGTATLAATGTLPDDTVFQIKARLVGRRVTGAADVGDVAAWTAEGSAKRVGGTLSVVAVAELLQFATGSDASLVGCSATVEVSGNTLRITVTPPELLVGNIDWFGTLEIYEA